MRRPPAFTLVETVISLFILVVAFGLVATLFHTAMRYSSRVEKQTVAVTVARRKMVEIRRWAREVSGGIYNFDTDWSAWNGVTAADAEQPDMEVTTHVVEQELYSPSSGLEAPYPEERRRTLGTSAKKLRIQVAWNPTSPSNRLTLVTLIPDPGRAFRTSNPLVVQTEGALASPLPRDATATFTVQGFSTDDKPLADLFFKWYVEPMTGNGTITDEARDGSRVTFANKVRLPNGAWTWTGGRCRLRVRAVYRGDERWADSPVMELAP